MKYTIDTDLRNFQAWSGATPWLQQAIENGTVDSVQSFIEDCYAGCDELPSKTDINDLLWFDEEVHRIIENKTVIERLHDLNVQNFSDETLEFIAEDSNLIDSDDNDTLEDALSDYEEFPTLQDAAKAKNCESVEQLKDDYIVTELEKSVIVTGC